MVKISPLQHPNSLYYSVEDIPFKCFKIFYKFIHICFGLDFGFIKFNKCFRIVPPELLMIIPGIIVGAWTIFDGWSVKDLGSSLFRSIFIIQYLLHVLILKSIKEKATFFNLIQDLRTIDLGLNVHHLSYNWELKLFLTICFYFMCRVFNYIMLIVDHRLPTYFNFGFIVCFILLLASDIVCITFAFMFYAVNCRLKMLGSLLKPANSDFLSKQYLYKSIVDIAEQHKEAFDPVLIIKLLSNIPTIMAGLYFSLVKIHVNGIKNNLKGFLVPNFITLQMLTLTAMPVLFAGMLATQAENIKLILHDLLFQQKCAAEFGEIKRFIKYVEARGCRFRVYKVIPLDVDLLRMILSFCVTYLIVIIQFTNK